MSSLFTFCNRNDISFWRGDKKHLKPLPTKYHLVKPFCFSPMIRLSAIQCGEMGVYKNSKQQNGSVTFYFCRFPKLGKANGEMESKFEDEASFNAIVMSHNDEGSLVDEVESDASAEESVGKIRLWRAYSVLIQ